MGCPIVIVGAILACDEDTLRFDAGDSTPSRFAAVSSFLCCIAKARIDEEILQRVVQRRADILSREPRRMREAPRRTQQNMGLRRGYEQSRGKMSREHGLRLARRYNR